MTIAELKPLWDCIVTLRLKDGEMLRAKIAWVDEEYAHYCGHYRNRPAGAL